LLSASKELVKMELPDTRPIHPWVADAAAGVRVGLMAIIAGDVNGLMKQVQAYQSLGYDSFWLADHPLRTSDPWTVLAAIARETDSIRLGVMVTCAAYRHPLILARVVADVDRISEGRVVLGIGSGDVPAEFAAMGLEYGSARDRRQRLEDSLKSIPKLLAGEV
jgi:alkanesulfonate monooxygenase SsuD/methylene tetrahydromethanopterin reductase-like flavin-dependent oxidoreductase (luciferase family)